MEVLKLILTNVILPLFSLIGLGAFLHRKFNFDMRTLSKLNTYVLLPVVSFENIYTSKIGMDILFKIIVFFSLQSLLLILLSTCIGKVVKLERSLASAFNNSVVLNNSGNFGVPVSQLVFYHNPLGQSIQVVVTTCQNLLTYTYGLTNSLSAKSSALQALTKFIKNPIFYAILLGLVFDTFSIKVPTLVMDPIESISNAFLAMALITLGAQSAFLNLTKPNLPLVISILCRLVLSPCIAFLIIFSLKLEGTTAQSLLIASSYPTSRNSALFALEYGNHAEYAAQAVILSTLLSSITVTIVVYVSKMMF